MTPELYYLALTALITAVIWIVHVAAIVKTYGFYGPKEYKEGKVLALPDWGQRAMRCHQNSVEQLAPFAVFVLVAHLTGANNEVTAVAAMAFFWLRFAYTVAFWIGVPYLRTALFVAAWVAELAIFWAIISPGSGY